MMGGREARGIKLVTTSGWTWCVQSCNTTNARDVRSLATNAYGGYKQGLRVSRGWT